MPAGYVFQKAALLASAVLVGACSTTFTSFSPTRGEVCDEVRIEAEGGHRCGPVIATFNGVRAEDAWRDTGLDGDVVVVVPPGASSGPLTVRQRAGGMGCIVAGQLDSELYELGEFTVTGSPPAPRITAFTASPTEIDEGEAVTLQWSVAGTTTRLELDDPGRGTIDVTGAGDFVVAPTESTDYRLTAYNACLTDTATETVLVNERQEQPVITDVDPDLPGEPVRASGNNLRYRPRAGEPYAESSLIFVQGTTTYAPVVDPSPGDTELEGDLPAAMTPGAASVSARVGVMTSEPLEFVVPGRENGAFGTVTLRTAAGDYTCPGDTDFTLEITGDGEERWARFEEDGSLLWRESFALGVSGTGAGFSPDCRHGVIVGQNTARDDNKFVLLVRDFEDGRTRVSETTLGQGVQVLFSPDDSVVLYKAQDDFRGVGFAVMHLYDLRENDSLPDPGPGNACTACNSLTARVVDFNFVEITFSGDDYGPYEID